MNLFDDKFSKRYHHPFQNDGYKTKILVQVIEILKSNTNETILFLSLNLSTAIEQIMIIPHLIRSDFKEILMLKALKT